VKPVYIAGAGIISPLGVGLAATELALRAGRDGIGPLALFSLAKADRLPVGEISEFNEDAGLPGDLPRCHRLALAAADQAMHGCGLIPEAVIVGCTTGGILSTENLLWQDDFFTRQNIEISQEYKEKYRYHGLTTVAAEIARRTGCFGPALTLSTACASGGAAIALALSLLRAGAIKTALAGGADSLSRLTCLGFHSLQLVDASGCKPLDARRRGINVAEGAGFLLLTTEKPEHVLGIIAGAGLSCDAYHASAPHPEGDGARTAMALALADAGIGPADVDYINLHGTGTPDNDAAEAKAIRRVFATPPPFSSIKGATGHSLAAAGGVEAVVAALVAGKGFIPGTTGCRDIDEQLGIIPELSPKEGKFKHILSNSFGFGGNNAALVIREADDSVSQDADSEGKNQEQAEKAPENFLAVHGCSCLTGMGDLAATMARLTAGGPVKGQLPESELCKTIPARAARRLGRLAKLALTLAVTAEPDGKNIDSVFFGSGWGALTETHNFLRGLAESAGQFPSPADFVGSTHNSAAGRIAIHFQAKGKNLAFSGGDFSFAQALFAAQTMLSGQENALLLAADEGHARFSPLFDPSIAPGEDLADGGGAFSISRERAGAKCLLHLDFYGRGGDTLPEALYAALGGKKGITGDYAAIFAGAPRATLPLATGQLAAFLAETGNIPVWRYRDTLGEFASAEAVAAAVAVDCCANGLIPGALVSGADIALATGQKILLLGLGEYITAISFFAP